MKNSMEIEKFWAMKKGEIVFPSILIRTFLSKHGFYKLVISKTSYTLVRLNKAIVEEVSIFVVKDFVLQYCDKHGLEDVKAKFCEDHGVINNAFLDILESLEIEFTRDTKNTSFLFFRNGVVCITSTDTKLIEYSDFDGYLWDSQVIDRDYKKASFVDCIFWLFCCNIASLGSIIVDKSQQILEQRIISLKSLIGYCLFNYKDKRTVKAIILMDMNLIPGQANGGTGKGLLVQGISKLRKTIIKDGKNLSSGRFLFQDYEPGTDVMFFDDVGDKFVFDDLFSVNSSGLTAERKYKPSIYIPFEESPKVIVATNSVLKGKDGSSAKRRKFEFEFSDHYGLDHTPEDDFEKILFEEWSDDEWHSFDNLMIDCIQFYLKNGLVSYEHISLKQNKLVANTSQEFVDFAKDQILFNTKYNKRDLCHEFLFSTACEITPHRFTKYLHTYSRMTGGQYSEDKTNGNYVFMITKIDAVAEEALDTVAGDAVTADVVAVEASDKKGLLLAAPRVQKKPLQMTTSVNSLGLLTTKN